MCLQSRMGNNNWLKQSLLWENKRSGRVASEGQAWWHSQHLNSLWLLGSGGCPAPPGALLTGTDLRGCWGRDEDAGAPAESFISITVPRLLWLLRSAWKMRQSERRTRFCARACVPLPWNHCTTALTDVTGAAVHPGDPQSPRPTSESSSTVARPLEKFSVGVGSDNEAQIYSLACLPFLG